MNGVWSQVLTPHRKHPDHRGLHPLASPTNCSNDPNRERRNRSRKKENPESPMMRTWLIFGLLLVSTFTAFLVAGFIIGNLL